MDTYYKPKNKKERDARRKVWIRYQAMRDDPLRREAERDWELGDKAFLQWMPPRELGDWRSHLSLPDSFAGIQAHMQETINRRSRPYLCGVESSDLSIEMFSNSLMKYSMDRTGFDYQEYLAKLAASIRGTSFVLELYRLEKRDVYDPTGINDDGSLKYVKKEIVDHDDTYTTFIENEFVFLDPGATHADQLRDMIHREVIDHAEFQRVYSKRPDFMNVKLVPKCGAVHDLVSFFQRPKDMTDDDVEVLHYYNRATDEYFVLANNVLIRMGYIPYKHKELPIAIHTHYNVPGRIWGLGIPKIIYSLTEERKSLRHLAVDRQNMTINKMYLVNDLVDLDDEDFRTRPNGFIPVNTNGLPLDNVIKAVDFGEQPNSYYKTEEMILQDIRRAHGINEQSQAIEPGGTATSAAITQQSAQKRIELINVIADMDTLTRIGRLKWSNVQFFYPAPRVERIVENNEVRTKKVYRTIRTEGQEFKVIKDDGSLRLQFSEIDGSSNFKLDKTLARFIEGNFDVTVKAEPDSQLSKPIRQAKITEMLNVMVLNPQLASALDPNKAAKRYLQINDEDPKDWLRGGGMTDADWKRLAVHENMVMATGQTLPSTQSAPEAHTEEHLNYMNSLGYHELIAQNPAIQQIFEEHVFGEHQNNPNTGDMAALLGGAGGSGMPGAPQGGTPPQRQLTDLQPPTAGGADRRDAQKAAVAQ